MLKSAYVTCNFIQKTIFIDEDIIILNTLFSVILESLNRRHQNLNAVTGKVKTTKNTVCDVCTISNIEGRWMEWITSVLTT